jgi:hypothetical protein
MLFQPERQRWLHRLTDFLLLLVLLALSVKMTYHISRVRDIGLGVYDEASYMSYAANIPIRGFGHATYSPLYCLWYSGLLLVKPERVGLYYLNWQILAFLVPASLYLLCRAASGGRAASLLLAFLVLTSAVVEVWPYPTYLGCVVLASGTALATSARSWRWSLAILGLTLVVASYVRPEVAVSFLVFCLVGLVGCVWTVWRQPRQTWRLVGPVLFVAGCTALFLRGLGNPLEGGRSFAAFSQHYAMNVMTGRKQAGDSIMRYSDIVVRDFGTADTLGQAWRANPRALLWHVWYNICRIPAGIGEMTNPRLELDPQVWAALIVTLLGAVGLGGAGVVRCLFRRVKPVDHKPDDWPGSKRRLIVVLLMLAILLAPTVPSALLIAPRTHYLMPTVLFLIALVGAGMASNPRLQRLWTRLEQPRALLGLLVVLLVVTPNRAHGWNVQALLRQPSAPPPVLFEQKVVSVLQRLPIRGPTVILDYSDRRTLAHLPGEVVHIGSKSTGFWDFIRQAGIGVIVIDHVMMNEGMYRNDPQFQEFVSGKEVGDFVFFAVPEVQVRIAVRKHLLSS